MRRSIPFPLVLAGVLRRSPKRLIAWVRSQYAEDPLKATIRQRVAVLRVELERVKANRARVKEHA